MSYNQNGNLQKLIKELENEPIDDLDLLKNMKSPVKYNNTQSGENNNNKLSPKISNISSTFDNDSINTESIQIATRVDYNPQPIETNENPTPVINTQPNIPMLPSKETLAYARRVSEQLASSNNNNHSNLKNNTNLRTSSYQDQMLRLASSKSIRRQGNDFSSIGSGNLASESGTSYHNHLEEEEEEQEQDEEETASEYLNEQIVPPRNKDRPKSQLYLPLVEEDVEMVKGETSTSTTYYEPPMITVENVDRLNNDNDGTSQEEEKEEEKEKEEKGSNYYHQRPVPKEPVETISISNDDAIDKIADQIIEQMSLNNTNNTSNNHNNMASVEQHINTLTDLITMTNNTTVGSEFQDLMIPPEERILLEQFIDTLSRLTTDLLLDPTRREESLRRLQSAARALEGF